MCWDATFSEFGKFPRPFSHDLVRIPVPEHHRERNLLYPSGNVDCSNTVGRV